MSDEIRVDAWKDAKDRSMHVRAQFQEVLTDSIGGVLIGEVVRQIAERYVAENYQAIAAKINQDALATLICAESAAKIRESLERTIPAKILEVERPVVYQRGIFGGMKRL